MRSDLGHKIKHREIPNNEFTTPKELAKKLIAMVPLEVGQSVLDPAMGSGSFFNNYPSFVVKDYCDITEGKDFLNYYNQTDWIITNPPYSDLDRWFNHSTLLANVGFAFLLTIHNLTPRRIEIANKSGFGLVTVHMCKVFEWYGISAFCIFQGGADNIISYDRIVWR